jgi:hypothetical protein
VGGLLFLSVGWAGQGRLVFEVEKKRKEKKRRYKNRAKNERAHRRNGKLVWEGWIG